jgi:hypothetical protein
VLSLFALPAAMSAVSIMVGQYENSQLTTNSPFVDVVTCDTAVLITGVMAFPANNSS